MKISIDFDGTLDMPHVQEFVRYLMKKYSNLEVWVVTARVCDKEAPTETWNNLLWKICSECNINKYNVKFMAFTDKYEFLKNKNFLFHIDDSLLELELLKEHTKVIPICHLESGKNFGGLGEWKYMCEYLINPEFIKCINCNNNGVNLHVCPYNSEINNDYNKCNCCILCEFKCTQEI